MKKSLVVCVKSQFYSLTPPQFLNTCNNHRSCDSLKRNNKNTNKQKCIHHRAFKNSSIIIHPKTHASSLTNSFHLFQSLEKLTKQIDSLTPIRNTTQFLENRGIIGARSGRTERRRQSNKMKYISKLTDLAGYVKEREPSPSSCGFQKRHRNAPN